MHRVGVSAEVRVWQDVVGIDDLDAATMTHGSTRGTPQAPPSDVVRLSVGIEDVEDLIEDLDAALATA